MCRSCHACLDRRTAVKRDWRPPENPRTSQHYGIGPRPDSRYADPSPSKVVKLGFCSKKLRNIQKPMRKKQFSYFCNLIFLVDIVLKNLSELWATDFL